MPVYPTAIYVSGDGVTISGNELSLDPAFFEMLDNANLANGVPVAGADGSIPSYWIPQSGTQEFFESAIPLSGQIVTCTTVLTPRIGDGVTPGGLDFALNSDSCVFVQSRRTVAQSGLALANAWDRARDLTPNTAAISATNKAYCVMGPGVFDLPNAGADLDMDTAGLNLIGWGGSSATTIISQENSNGIIISADSTLMQGLTLKQSTSSATSIIRYNAATNTNIIHRDIVYEAINLASGRCMTFHADVVSLGGLYERIRANCPRMYGHLTMASGISATFRDCDNSAASSVLGLGLGSGATSGTPNTFTGLIENCRYFGNLFLYVTGIIRNSYLRSGSSNNDVIKVGIGANIYRNTLIAQGTGYGIGIVASETPNCNISYNIIKPGSGGEAIHASIVNDISDHYNSIDASYPTSI